MTITPGTVTLANGDAVADTSLAWLDETRARQRHVDTLLHIGNRQARADYIAQVRHREGAESARRLQARFAAVWEERKRAEDAAKADLDAARKAAA
jgi:septal ring factor EnvC (AmiA/AmiB activator)